MTKSMTRPVVALAVLFAVQSAHADPRGSAAVDAAVDSRLADLGIPAAARCSDAVFVRRVYLDVIGTLPTAEEVEAFLHSSSPRRRAELIDALLERTEFADYWTLKWCDLLRVKAEFPINLWPNAAAAFHRWLRASIRDGMPYDAFVRALLTSNGSNFRVAPVNFYRTAQSKDPETLARITALAFMGVRIEAWPEARRKGLAGFFAYVGFKPTREWKEEIVYFDSIKAIQDAHSGSMVTAVLPDGAPVELSPAVDPRIRFADWLTAPDNRWFARNICNRAWSWLMGRGVIHEPDDIRPDNPPSNPKLLAVLERELVASRYDLKHIFRVILNSQTYQRSSAPASDHPDAEAQFAHYSLRRLEAEVLIDALCQVTGTTESYSSQIPEPFTFIPEDHRTITLPDGSITSPFLELFGKPPRDTGLESERNNRPTPAQRLHLLNSSHVLQKIQRGEALRPLVSVRGREMRPKIKDLYLTILSRYPTREEVAVVAAYAQQEETQGSKALEDLAWALINSTEFLYRH